MANSDCKRNQNFSNLEKEVLLSVLENNKNLRETAFCPKNDALSSSAKTKAWNAILSKFQSCGNVNQRTEAQLFQLWKNMKKAAKTADAKVEHFKLFCKVLLHNVISHGNCFVIRQFLCIFLNFIF